MANLITCRCGAQVPDTDGATHKYLDAVPGCWAIYGEILAREYEDFTYMKVHHLTVDAYAVQHPGSPSPQTIQSVAVHLISLHHQLEKGSDIETVRRAMQAATQDKGRFKWLEPPASFGEITVLNAHRAENAMQHQQIVRQWAEAAWKAWSAHHDTIREWAAR